MWGTPTSPSLAGGVLGDPREVGHSQRSLTGGAVGWVLSLGHGVCRQGPGEASSSAASSASARLSSSKLVQAKVRFRLQQFEGGELLGNSALGGLIHRGAEVVMGTPVAMGQQPPWPWEGRTGLSPPAAPTTPLLAPLPPYCH